MKATKINIKRIMMTGFIIYTVITLANQQVAIGKLATIQKDKTQMVENINLENQKLEALIKNASTNENIEKMAREQLGLVKSGEKVYINQTQPETDLQGGDN